MKDIYGADQLNNSTRYVYGICVSGSIFPYGIFSRYDSAVIAAFLTSDGGNINRIDVSEINGRSALGIDAAVVVNSFVLSGIDNADELAFALNIKGFSVYNKSFRRFGVIAWINTRYTDIDAVIFIFGCPYFLLQLLLSKAEVRKIR